MFAGIVEGLAQVKKIEPLIPGKRFHIDIHKFAEGVKPGASICISGCCLTATKLEGSTAIFDILPETLNKTYFHDLKENEKVNVERSLKLGDEIGGHFVTGHIDCTGTITERKDHNDFSEMTIEFPKEFSHLLIDKGSIAVDGISLTVVNAETGRFTIALIPTTLELTTLGFKKVGDPVNLEFDQFGKYIAKMLHREKESTPLTL